MIIQLDPFHLIRGINCPEPVERVIVENIFRMDSNPPIPTGSSFAVTLCGGGTTVVDTRVQWRYFTFNHSFASSYIFGGSDCDKLDQTILIRGKVSGAEIIIPFGLKSGLGWPNCLTEKCYVVSDDGAERWNGSELGGITQIVLDQAYVDSDWGFDPIETCDAYFPAPPKQPISLISERPFSGIYIDFPVAHDFPEFSAVRISGTDTTYDGDYLIQDIVSTTRIWVDKTYTVDVSQGTAERYYNRK